jgi:hypothetical protein
VTNHLAGSDVEGMARVFIWVIIPIVGMPWGYVARTYVWNLSKRVEYKLQ